MPETGRLRLFPLNTVLFPGAALNLHVFEDRYRKMIAECLDAGEAFGVVLIRDGEEAGDPGVTPHEVGTTAEIADVTLLPAGRYYISTTGGRRFRIARDRQPRAVPGRRRRVHRGRHARTPTRARPSSPTAC